MQHHNFWDEISNALYEFTMKWGSFFFIFITAVLAKLAHIARTGRKLTRWETTWILLVSALGAMLTGLLCEYLQLNPKLTYAICGVAALVSEYAFSFAAVYHENIFAAIMKKFLPTYEHKPKRKNKGEN